MATRKFPLGKCRAVAAHVKNLHEHLQGLLAGIDADAEDDGASLADPSGDHSDADQPYAQGQDAKTVKSMDEAFPNMARVRR